MEKKEYSMLFNISDMKRMLSYEEKLKYLYTHIKDSNIFHVLTSVADFHFKKAKK